MECRIKTKGRKIARNKIDVKAADLSAVFLLKDFHLSEILSLPNLISGKRIMIRNIN